MSVRKRTWSTPKGETRETWVVDYVDQAGKRHIKTFARKKDADGFHASAKVEVRERTHTAHSSSITLSHAADFWITTCEGRGLERSPLESYRQHVKFHIRPFLGNVKLSQLSAPLVREFEDKLRRGDPAPGETEGKARSPAMIRKIATSLGAIVADAQERGLIARNVVRDLRSRRQKGSERRADRRQKGKLKVGVDIPTPQEIKAIVTHLEGRWRPILLTAIFSGLRSSELRGLRWHDVNLKKGEIHVRQRVDQWGAFGAPKSESGERIVPLPPIIVNTLREWKLACPKGELDLIFPTGRGTPENHANVINRGLQPAQVAAGVVDKHGAAKYTGLHSLRHFYASWCINRRADGGLELPLKVVQERMGHSSVQMTADRYGHLFPRADDGSELAAAERALLG
ncbi:site-specific integrase [Methylocystis sp. L43]|uniref:tyrosine-type recombinase/integrase n=1 Tax=unclassified Methylocystis TaxID=2625913 RepID=UPI0018C22A07|nr:MULTISPECIES: site-specific integrase [unclassified Methylocystis]MBG0797845.1 site-specific integrase [Methylocystis sp. L43]MBG0806079.1 site-specific integrase [Methylocystis sp. H15]